MVKQLNSLAPIIELATPEQTLTASMFRVITS